MLHPSKLFEWCAIRIGIDTFEIIDENLRQKLINLHPRNFIKSRITLPVYKVIVRYETVKGNYKKSEKYMVMESLDEAEYSDMWADLFARDYEEEYKQTIKNIEVIEVQHMCDAVLQIG